MKKDSFGWFFPFLQGVCRPEADEQQGAAAQRRKRNGGVTSVEKALPLRNSM